ncbi:DUF423 domain-containing protein [Flavobacterium sp. CS20]|uniref:DUF423 domain-containing protein n=1 Tax=Flavobacterium sp. CS20 TaxID=2775246 RepID=UPI001B39EA9B|nr:DUF423 domain-containing protein [Flavobacterium sp. CS20]QTY26224.1 DUF423 domain-containing protein [Flavobacterium sp. CS20]
MRDNFKIFGAFFGLLAVIIGAFGTHGLSDVLSVDQLQSFETGVKYQMYHALLMLILSFALGKNAKYQKAIFYLLCFGIIFFSFSIYGLATNELYNFDFTKLAFLTPIGGSLMILGWILMIISFLKKN